MINYINYSTNKSFIQKQGFSPDSIEVIKKTRKMDKTYLYILKAFFQL